MAYGVKYRISYCNKENVTARLDIEMRDYVGATENVIGTTDLFKIGHKNENDNKTGYIISTFADINLYEHPITIDNLKTLDETAIRISYYINNVLRWQGFALPDFFETEITKNAIVSISATDRLSALKERMLSRSELQHSPISIISECLQLTGLNLNINSVVDFRPSARPSTFNIMRDIRLNKQRLTDDKGRDISAFDTLTSILALFNCYIVQRDNEWWIVNKYQLENGGGKLYKYNPNGTFVSQDYFTPSVKDIDLISVGGRRKIEPSAFEVSLYGEYGGMPLAPRNYDFSNYTIGGFTGWTAYEQMPETINTRNILSYSGTDAVLGDGSMTQCFRYKASYFPEPQIQPITTQPSLRSEWVDISGFSSVNIEANFNLISKNGAIVALLVVVKDNSGNYWTFNNDEAWVNMGSNYSLLKKGSARLVEISDKDLGANDAVNTSKSINYKLNARTLGSDVVSLDGCSAQIWIMGTALIAIDTFITSAKLIVKDEADAPRGTMAKVQQYADFSKKYPTTTVIFSDYVRNGINGFFYGYRADDTSVIRDSENNIIGDGWVNSFSSDGEYLILASAKEMSRLFSSARDVLTIEIDSNDFDILDIYKCGEKRFIATSLSYDFFRSKLSLTLEENVISNTSKRDFLYSYFGGSDNDNIKSVGGITSGGSGGGGGSAPQYWQLDENGNLFTEYNAYSTKELSAYGLGEGSGGGGGSLVVWGAESNGTIPLTVEGISKTIALKSGLDLKQDKLTAGSGITIVGNTISANIQELSWDNISGKPLTYTPSEHTHNASDIDAGVLGIARIPTGTTGTTVALGNHTHTFASLTSKPTTLSGYGITNAYTKTEVDTKLDGKVSSVGLTAPTGFTVSNSPITSSGDLGLSFASGYSLPTTAKQTNWDLAYTDRHTHSNKTVIDKLKQSDIDVLAKLSLVNGNLQIDTNVYSTGEVSAYGLGSGSGGGGGGSLVSWGTEANSFIPLTVEGISKIIALQGHTHTKAQIGLGNVDNTSDLSKPISTATQTALNIKLETTVFNTHNNDNVRHITGAERTKWDTVVTDFGNLEIGGRNLIILQNVVNKNGRLSGVTNSTNYIFSDAGFYTTDKIYVNEGDEVVLTSHRIISGYLALGYFDEDDIFFSRPIMTLNFEANSYVLTIPSGVAYIRVSFLGSDSDCIKLEKGNKATDWSPAPEDQVSDWLTTDVNSFSYIKNKPTLLSQFTDNIGVATHIANKANPHNVTKAQIGLGNVLNVASYSKIESDERFAPLAGFNLHVNDNIRHITSAERTKWNTVVTKADNYVGLYTAPNGFLVKTNVARTENSMLVLHIKGNSYGGVVPINTLVQVYNYITTDSFINVGALNNGYEINEVKAFYYNNLVYFWVPEIGSRFQTMTFQLLKAEGQVNRVVSVSNSAIPVDGVEKLVTIIPTTAWFKNTLTQLSQLTDNIGVATHIANNVIHITAQERTNWNLAYSERHPHPNKPVIDQLTQDNINVLKKMSMDGLNIKVNTNLYSTGEVSAYGLGSGSGGGGGGSLVSWGTEANSFIPLTVEGISKTVALLGHTHTKAQIGLGNVLNVASYSKIESDERFAPLTGFNSHVNDNIRHITGAERTKWDGVVTDFAELEIGGRNLLENTSKKLTMYDVEVNSGHTMLFAGFNCKLEVGKTYTFSWEGEIISGYTPRIDVGTGTGTNYTRDIVQGLNVFLEGKYTFTVSDFHIANGDFVAFRVRYSNNASKFTFGALKLEKGTIPTDWSPAPEDQVSDWNTTDINSFSFIKNKPTKLSDFADNIGVGAHIANKANPHLVTTAQIGAVDLTTNQNIGGVKSFEELSVESNSRAYLRLYYQKKSNWPNYSSYITNTGAVSEAGTQGLVINANVGRIDTNYGINLAISDISRVFIQYTGNVGIGTTSPAYKLDVNGTARFTNNVTAPTFSGALSGNATTATTLQIARTIAGVSFDGSANIAIPFANLINKPTTIAGYGIINGALTTTNMIAGNGLSGGGTLASDRTITLGTPSNITVSTGNSVTATSHTHSLNLGGTSSQYLNGTTGLVTIPSITAGNGLSGGGQLTASQTLTLGTPSTLTATSTNAVTASSHTHAITTTSVGLANTIVQTDASGGVRGEVIRIGTNWTLELVGTELQVKYNGALKQRFLADGSFVATGEITSYE